MKQHTLLEVMGVFLLYQPILHRDFAGGLCRPLVQSRSKVYYPVGGIYE